MKKQENNIERSGKKGKIALTVSILIAIALLGIVIFLLLGKNGDNDAKKKRNVVVNAENVGQVVSELNKARVAPGSYEVTMNSTWNFANGKAASDNAYVENAETNNNAVYFDITRSDTGATIFESPILPIGSHLENITLDSKLSEGTYDCVMTYHLLDDEEKNISSVRLNLTIVVEQ